MSHDRQYARIENQLIPFLFWAPVAIYGLFTFTDGPDLASQIIMACLTIFCAVVAVRGVRQALVLRAERVVVRGMFRTRKVHISDVDDLRIGTWHGVGSTTFLVTRTGRQLNVGALAPPNLAFRSSESTQRQIDDALRDMRQAQARLTASGRA